MNCEGAEKGRGIGRIDTFMVVKVIFEEPEELEEPAPEESAGNAAYRDLRRSKWGRNCHSVDVKFYLMENLSDPIILGFPELSSLGCYVEPVDSAGRRWVQLAQAGTGLRLPVLEPARKKTASLTVVGTVKIVGPNSTVAELALDETAYQHAVE